MVGVLNKLLTVVGSVVLGGDRTSAGGILALTVCVTAAAGYQQAPLRGAATQGAEAVGRRAIFHHNPNPNTNTTLTLALALALAPTPVLTPNP